MAEIEFQRDSPERREQGGWWPPEGPRRAWAIIGLVAVGLVTLSFLEPDTPEPARTSPPEIRIATTELTEQIKQLNETHQQFVNILKDWRTTGPPTTVQVSIAELTEQIKNLNEIHNKLVTVLEGRSDSSLWTQLRDELRNITSWTQAIVNELKELKQIEKKVVKRIDRVAETIGNLKLVCGGVEGPCEVNPDGCEFKMTVRDYRVQDGDRVAITVEKIGGESTSLAGNHKLSKLPKPFGHKLEPGSEYMLTIQALNQGKVGRNTVEAFFSHADTTQGRWAMRKGRTRTIELHCP